MEGNNSNDSVNLAVNLDKPDTSASIEYRLATVEDFLAVPQESIAECLNDFAIWLNIVRKAKQGDLPRALDVPGFRLRADRFTWADDGQSGMSAIDLAMPDGEILGRISLNAEDCPGIKLNSPQAT